MKWSRLLLCLLGTSLLLACNFSPDMLSPQEEIRGMGESGDASTTITQEAVTVTVAPDGSGDYTRLDLAMEEVPAGSTIILEAGTFLLTEPLSVTKAITLVGAGMDRTDVVSAAEDYVVHFGGDGPFTAQGITFRHQGDKKARTVGVSGGEIDFTQCRFTGAVWDEDEDFGGNGLNLQANTTGRVQECRMEGNELYGIAVKEQSEVELERNVCSDNNRTGIRFSESSGGTARQNECASNGMHGISVRHQAQPTLEGNFCRDNEQVGIRFSETTGGTARQNECTGNGLSGIIVKDQGLAHLEENICTDNEQNGIAYFEGGGGTAQGNECSGNGMHGISVNGQAQPTLEGNVCLDNEEVGIRFSETTGGAARQNECSQNMRTGIAVVGEAQPSIEGNICVGNRWGIWVDETANPELVDNDCRDNSEADIEDRSESAGTRTGLGTADDEGDEQAPSTPSATSKASFGPISFSLEVVEGTNEPINPSTVFSAGPTEVYGSFDFHGMAADVEWTLKWYLDGVEVVSSTEEWGKLLDWDGEPVGRNSSRLYWASGRSLDPGEYELRLYIEDELMQSGTFIIGSAEPKSSFGPISFSLDVVDDTKEPINPDTVFLAGTTMVVASFDYQGMADDMNWTRKWYQNEVEAVSTDMRWDEDPTDPTWRGGPSGRRAIRLFYPSGKALEAGTYEFRIYIEGQLMQSGNFVIE